MRKWVPTDTESTGSTTISDLPASRNGRIKCLLSVSHPVWVLCHSSPNEVRYSLHQANTTLNRTEATDVLNSSWWVAGDGWSGRVGVGGGDRENRALSPLAFPYLPKAVFPL